MLAALSRVVSLLSVACAIVSLFLPWSHVVVSTNDDSRPVDVVIVKTDSQLSAPSLSLFFAPAAISLACCLLLWPLYIYASLGSLLQVAAGSAAIPLLFIFPTKVAAWSSPEIAELHHKGSGWWLCLASAILVIISGALAAIQGMLQLCTRCRSRSKSRKEQRVTVPDFESIKVESPPKQQQQLGFPPEKLPMAPDHHFNITPVYDQKRGDWFAASRNPLYSDPGRAPSQPAEISSGQDFIPAMRLVPHLGDLERLQSKLSEQRWISGSGSESLREKVGHDSQKEESQSSDDDLNVL